VRQVVEFHLYPPHDVSLPALACDNASLTRPASLSKSRALSQAPFVDLQELRVRMFLNITRNYQDGRSEAELLALFARTFLENDWPGRRAPEVFYDPRGLSMESGPKAALHAKCIVVDDEEALITSANFTEAAQERNIEAGVLVRIPSFAMSLREQFDTLVNHSQLRRVPGIGSPNA
jgi:phosphatidylserine/phosphatidylglycerophosphate/cardiolipin synthase-like enzyme